MDNLLLVCLFYAIAVFYAVQILRDVALAWMYRTALKRELEIRAQPIELSVEEIDGTVYGWLVGTQDFACQGRTFSELRDNFKLRYPGKSALIADGPENLLIRLRQEFKDLKQNENLNCQ